MEELNSYTIVLSNGAYRTIKAKTVTSAFISNLAYLLRSGSELECKHIIDEKKKIIYEELEWALIFSDRDMEHEIGSAPRYTEKEIDSMIRGYARFYGLSEDSATNYLKKKIERNAN